MQNMTEKSMLDREADVNPSKCDERFVADGRRRRGSRHASFCLQKIVRDAETMSEKALELSCHTAMIAIILTFVVAISAYVSIDLLLARL
jgi:hypothetical protein